MLLVLKFEVFFYSYTAIWASIMERMKSRIEFWRKAYSVSGMSRSFWNCENRFREYQSEMNRRSKNALAKEILDVWKDMLDYWKSFSDIVVR